ncbi:MAG: M28 family peptidase, partial [Armatimonadetes bacterium]|nr:M28 family peptidase [Armatimonadota bacterium]
MKQRFYVAWLMAAVLAAFSLHPLHAQDDEEEEENKPTPEQAQMYRALTDSRNISPVEIRATMQRLTQHPSRVVGYPGNKAAGDYILSEYRRLGLEDVQAESFDATVPIDEGATLTLGGQKFPLRGLWPNNVRTTQVPPDGLSGHLIYAGSGAIGELNGKRVEDSIVLVDFNSGTEWLNGPRLGAKAVIFIEPERTLRGEAEAKFLSVPLNMPRFWVSRTDAPALIAASRSQTAPNITIHSDMPWEKRTGRNIIGFLPGTDPELKKQVIVIESYYDSMSVVPALAPGAESSSGVAAQLQLIKTFTQPEFRPKRTVMFLSTDGHFMGLSGIRNFLHTHWDELEQRSTGENFRAWLNRTFPFLFKFNVPEPKYQIYLFAGLDLSSKSKGVGVFYKGWYYDFREDLQSKFSDIGRVFRENSEKVAQTLNLDAGERFADGINPVSGKNWRNFIPGKPAFDAEVVTMAGGKGVTFATVDDARNLVDTPLDTIDRVNFGNLAEQTRMLAALFWHAMNDPNGVGIQKGTHFPITEPSAFGKLKLQGGFASVYGRVLEFDPKKSIVPNEPVMDSIVVLPRGSKTYMGVRGDRYQIVDNNKDKPLEQRATFAFHGVPPLTAYGGRATTSIAAYHLNPTTGEVDYAPDQGVTGAKFNYPLTFQITTGKKETGVVLFRCNTTALYDLIDPSSLRTLPTIAILDAQTNGEPRMFGFDKTKPEPLVSHIEDVALIYAQPYDPTSGTGATRVKVLGQAGPGAIRMALINATEKDPEGVGYDLTGRAIANTSLKVAMDMYTLNDYRIKKLEKHRILNPAIYDPVKNAGLHVQGKREIEKALVAQKAMQWDAFDAHSRAAWGFEARAYPDVKNTMNDVVKGVLFYLFLLMPFSYFTERLLIGSKFLKNQIAWTLGIFIGIFMIFRYIHPAFDITMNPMIVLLAFIMLALSLLVIIMLSGRFEKELKEFNQQISGVHRVDIGRMSVAAAAFSLGISNMRRRKARTILTCSTLVLLTFTVLSVTSVVPTIRFNKVPAPGEPYYSGVMLRTPNWDTLEESAYRLLNDEFGASKPVAARAWFFGTTGPGEQSFITLKKGDKKFDAKALVGLTPEEENVTSPGERSLKTGRWFLPGD